MKVEFHDTDELLVKLEELKSFYTEPKPIGYHYYRIEIMEGKDKLYHIDYNPRRGNFISTTDLSNPYIGFSNSEVEAMEKEERKYNKTIQFSKSYSTSTELVLDFIIIAKNSRNGTSN